MAHHPKFVSYGKAVDKHVLVRWRTKEKLSKEILEAITTANYEQVKDLLQDQVTRSVPAGALADYLLTPSTSTEHAFRTPLMAAAARGNVDIFRAVLSAVRQCVEGLEIMEVVWKKQLMSQDLFGKTLLMLAVTSGDILFDVLYIIYEFQVSERLLDQDYRSNTVLMHTVSSVSDGFFMFVRVLRAIELCYSKHKVEEHLLARSSDGSTILIKAAKKGDAEYLSHVLRTFTRIVLPHEVRKLARHCDRERVTFLMHAASCSEKDQAGAQGQSDEDGTRDRLGVFNSAFGFVKSNLSKKQIRNLLKAEDAWGKTVMEHAFHSGNEKVFRAVVASVREEIGDFKTEMILNTSGEGTRGGSTAKQRSFSRRTSELKSSPIRHDPPRTYAARLEASTPVALIAIFLLAVPDSADNVRGALGLLIVLTVVAPLLYWVVNVVATQKLASTRRSVMTFLLFAPAMFCWGLGTTSIGQDAFGLSKSASVALPLLATIFIPALDSLLSHLLQLCYCQLASREAGRPTERAPERTTGVSQSTVQGQIRSNEEDTDSDGEEKRKEPHPLGAPSYGEEKRKEPHPLGAPSSSDSDAGSEVASSVQQISATPAAITDAQSSGTYAIDIEVADGDDGAASSGKGTVVAGGLGGQTLPESEWRDVSICGQSRDVSPSGDTVVFDFLRDAFGFVEVKVAHEESALMINVKLVDRVYTEEILVRGERDTYFIDPVVEGPHGVEFAKASIRYFVGRYDGLLVRFDRNREGTPDKENEKSGIGSLAVQQYFPVHKPDRSEDNVNPPWEPYGEFKAVWDGDALWLEASLTHFSCIGNAFRQFRRNLRGVTPPLSPSQGVENAMVSGLIQAAEDVVPSRLIRLVNNTKQTVRTCVTPDASPNQQATKKKAAGVGLNVLGYGGDAHRSKHASHQHGAMGGSGNASLGAQHNTLGPGQSTKDPLGGHDDGGVVWYTVNEFTPNDLESRKFDPAPPPAGNATPSPTQTQAGRTPSAQAQVQPEHPLVCGFSLARLEAEHGYVVDQKSQNFVRKSRPLFAWTGPETFPWLIMIRIRHNARISPGMYYQMNEAKLTQERVKDFVLRPGEDVDQKVNQYVKANLV